MAPNLQSIPRAAFSHVKAMNAHNIASLRSQPLLELSGAFGDLGTFIPIFVALASTDQISAPATLIFSGIANIFTGVLLGIPLPVQPMKAIAAIALQKDLSNAEIAGAGFFVAAAVGLFSILGLLNWFTRVVPVPVIKGIQVGAGLSLMLSAFTKSFPSYIEASIAFAIQSTLLLAMLLLLLFQAIHPRVPSVLIVVLVSGIASIAGALIQGAEDVELSFGIWHPVISVPTGSEFLSGSLTAGLGQLPLTTLNSILAVVILAQDLFPVLHNENKLPSAGQVGMSVSIMNLACLWFGSMPFCHGSGGLAAQYRFGARSGASIIMLGAFKLILGLFASDFVTAWCSVFADEGAAVLGVLVFLAGLELAKLGQNLNSKGARDLWVDEPSSTTRHESNTHGSNHTLKVKALSTDQSIRRWTIMIVTIGSLLGAKNDGVGFVVGMVVHWAYQFTDYVEHRRQGTIRLRDDD